MKNAVVIDPGTHTGYAIVVGGSVISTWSHAHQSTISILASLESLYSEFDIHHLVIEDQFLGMSVKSMLNTRDKAMRWVAMAESLCWETEWLHPSTWQAQCGLASRQCKLKGAKHKRHIRRIASGLAGRDLGRDECDAYMMALYWIGRQKLGV